MNKLKEAIEFAKFTNTSTVCLSMDYAERLYLELMKRYETPTLEEVKKEWEDEDFEIISCSKEKFEVYKQWIERINHCSHHKIAKIVIEKDFFYIVGQFSNKYTQLLTKTFKALGWEM